MHHKFDDIRPFCTSEIPEAMQVIAESEHFELLARYIFPDRDIEEVREMIRAIRTTDEFQINVMYYVNEQIVRRSITQLTQNSFAHLDPQKQYLFVSNHRDIMLDSSLLQYILHINGFRTTEITFGSNLMRGALVTNIGRANKMFKVIRSSNLHDFLKNSMHLSEYIRYTLTQKDESIWIAQRNGRTKDGHDATDQGIIKMFCMSDKSDLAHSVGELNIVPMAISYQIEPCDILKTRELYLSRDGEKYVKQPDEDLNSILTGITQPKGHVHISLGEPITYEQLPFDHRHANEFYKGVASLIDQQIYTHYKLYDNNYIAHDLRSGTSTYADRYTLEAKKTFEERCNAMLQQLEGDRDTLLNIFLGIYANPVENALSCPEKG
ncbi:acyltransferase [Tannerella forsythia]|uniref:Acyltransferase n=1 Tax=Tannerella forsythia TaxID=28112 RepID=A0A3P1Z1R9_TANFO|nr:acyltransferase [Tannerella forsythia]RRD77292.1 acyltransferase [Tannerella forsythia]